MPIKPCPFCGFDGCEVDGRFDVCAVECLQCWARGPESTYDECVEMWNGIPRKIKMTKELPTEVGYYYWCKSMSLVDVQIVQVTMVDGVLILDDAAYGCHPLSMFNCGYWAKVEQDQFEFVD